MWFFWLSVGIVLGTIFHAFFAKWWNRGKATAKEIKTDVVQGYEKVTKKQD